MRKFAGMKGGIRIFPNEASATRLIGALLTEQHKTWSTGRKYSYGKCTYRHLGLDPLRRGDITCMKLMLPSC